MNTQEAVATLYEAEDVLRKRIPSDEEILENLTKGLARLQRYCEEIMEELEE